MLPAACMKQQSPGTAGVQLGVGVRRAAVADRKNASCVSPTNRQRTGPLRGSVAKWTPALHARRGRGLPRLSRQRGSSGDEEGGGGAVSWPSVGQDEQHACRPAASGESRKTSPGVGGDPGAHPFRGELFFAALQGQGGARGVEEALVDAAGRVRGLRGCWLAMSSLTKSRRTTKVIGMQRQEREQQHEGAKLPGLDLVGTTRAHMDEPYLNTGGGFDPACSVRRGTWYAAPDAMSFFPSTRRGDHGRPARTPPTPPASGDPSSPGSRSGGMAKGSLRLGWHRRVEQADLLTRRQGKVEQATRGIAWCRDKAGVVGTSKIFQRAVVVQVDHDGFLPLPHTPARFWSVT